MTRKYVCVTFFTFINIMKEINSLYKNSAGTRPRVPAHTWNVFWLRSSLILNLLYFGNIPILQLKYSQLETLQKYVKMIFSPKLPKYDI